MIRETTIEQMVSWRHHLHQNPEFSTETVETAAFLAGILRSYGYEVHDHFAGNGVVARLKRGDSKKSIGIRADMDALKIQERTGLPYASTNGCMHACGHDGHMAMLLGAAAEIAENCNFSGIVNLIFQPAEETTVGAGNMVDAGLFRQFPMDEIYGLHNVPFYPLGTVSTRVGGIMSSEDDFIITIKGGGCHASSPHEGVDPFLCFAQIYQALQAIVSRNCNPTHSLTVSCTEIVADGARNAIPNALEIRGDVRCFSGEDQELVERRMREICKSVGEMNGAETAVQYSHECASIQNAPECVDAIVAAAIETIGKEKVNASCAPWMASEDFSEYLNCVPGGFFLLGSNEGEANFTPLHSPLFNFNDKLLPIGAEVWKNLVEQRLM